MKCKDENKIETEDLGKKLSDMIKFKKKLSAKKPKLIINLRDDLKSTSIESTTNELPHFFVTDIQRAALYLLVASQIKIVPSWCKILRPNTVKSLVLITINNLCENDYQQQKDDFLQLDNLFENKKNQTVDSFTFVSSHANRRSFIEDFMFLPTKNLKWVSNSDEPEKKKFKPNELSRVSILLSVEQMLKEDYPLPFDPTHDFSDYVFSKQNYEAVDDSSPMFGIDCEMCYNIDGEMEVVWIAIVDESLNCIYETLVKPSKPIVNYLTHITGVTEGKLRNVITTLADVRKKITELLPPNGILCGQSLNNDLHALKMFHPYVIDTSVIFNLTGSRDQKTSLKYLALQFLKEKIQQQSHNPVFDARVSLRLVLLKLCQGLEFGDVIINGIPMGEEKISEGNDAGYETIFDMLDRLSVKSILIDRQLNIKHQDVDSLKHFNFKEVSNNKNAYKALHESLNTTKFVWCQLYNDKKFKTNEFLENLKEVDDKLNDDSFLIVVFNGDMIEMDKRKWENIESFKNHYKGRFFIKHKNFEFDQLDKEIKLLYDLVKNKNTT